MKPLFLQLTLLLAAAGPAAFAAPGGDVALARGAQVAQWNCAACHAVTAGGRSPNASAPTFADLRLRYNPISLERRLTTFPKFGHEAMPPRSLAADDVAGLVAYIQSLEPAKGAP